MKHKSEPFWGQLFSLDRRSLAFLRVGLAAVILYDLFNRLPYLVEFHTDLGVLPRISKIDFAPTSSKFSLYFISGEPWFVWILFIVSLFFAFTLLVGYRTRLSTLISWILAISLQGRNDLILSSADTLLRLLLLWSVFLPLGDRFSFDHAFGKSGINEDGEDVDNTVSGFLVLPFTFQMGAMYVFTALLKYKDPSWKEGTAAFYAMGTEDYLTTLGAHFAQFVGKHSPFSLHTIYYEIVAGILLVFASRLQLLRLITAFSLILMHLAFDLFFEINFFSWLSIFALVAFFPACFWEWLSGFIYSPKLPQVKAYYDRDCGFCKKSALLLKEFFLVKNLSVNSTASDVKAHHLMEENNSWVVYKGDEEPVFKTDALRVFLRNSAFAFLLNPLMRLSFISKVGDRVYEQIADHRKYFSLFTSFFSIEKSGDGKLSLSGSESKGKIWFFKFLALFFTLYILSWNLNNQNFGRYRLARWFMEPGYFMRIDQSWRMFVKPTKRNGWIVTTGELRSGQEVDPLREVFSRPSFEKPENIHDSYPSYRWKKYFKNLRSKNYEKYRRGYGRYICRKWNKKYQGALALREHQLVLMSQVYDENLNKKPPKKSVIWRHWCFDRPKKKSKSK